MQLADSLDRLGTETAFELLARAKALEAQGRDIIHLQIGEPDFDTPAHVVEAAAKALRDGHTHYCPAPGIPQLREAAAAYLGRSRGIAVDPANVLVTPARSPSSSSAYCDLQPRRRGHLPEPRAFRSTSR